MLQELVQPAFGNVCGLSQALLSMKYRKIIRVVHETRSISFRNITVYKVVFELDRYLVDL